MSNPMNASQTIAVPFYGVELFVVEHGPQPYTPMKPIAEGMGLDWRTQYRKLIQGDQQKDHADLNGQNDHAGLNHRNSGSGRRRWGITEIVMQLPGDDQRRAITCLPLRKLPGWLMTIHPNKVRPEIRENVIRYQNECDDALWDYWTKGQATRQPIPAKPLPKPRVPAPLPWPRWYYLFEADAFGIKGDPFEAGKVLARCHLLRLRREAAVPGCPPNSRALLFNGFLRRIEQLGGIRAFLACKEGGEMYVLNRLIGGFFWELDVRAQSSAIDMPGLDGAEAEWRGIAEART